MKGFSPAADNNKSPILSVLTTYLADGDRVFEVGSGSGQHALYMSASLPNIQWVASERESTLPLLRANLNDYGTPNIAEPTVLDLAKAPEPDNAAVQCVYAANVVHIVSEPLVINLVNWAGIALDERGFLILYGPYRYKNEFTTVSNQNFDRWLKDRDPQSGVRDFEWVNAVALNAGLSLVEDHSMPANNQCLVFQKRGQRSDD